MTNKTNPFDDRILIGETMSDGDFQPYVMINNTEGIFGEGDTPHDPRCMSLAELLTILRGTIAANIAARDGMDEAAILDTIEVHRACRLTQTVIPDLMEQTVDSGGEEYLCDFPTCADHQ